MVNSSITWSTKLYFARVPFTATLNPRIAILAFKVSKSTLPNAADGIVPFIISEILQNKKKVVIALSDNKYLNPFATYL